MYRNKMGNKFDRLQQSQNSNRHFFILSFPCLCYLKNAVEYIENEIDDPLFLALKAFKTALQIYPDKIENYINLSTCYFENGESKKSIDTIIKGAELNPENFDSRS